jgi:hypothetical protein
MVFMKNNAAIIVIFVAAIGILGVYFLVSSLDRSSEVETIQTTQVTESESQENNLQPEENGVMMAESIIDIVMNNPDSLTVKLEDVALGSVPRSGAAYILRSDNKLYHAVTAVLPDPPGTTFYEGWLVIKKPTLKFISTGDMVKDKDGMYKLEFSSEEPYEGYNDVVITLEKIKDDTPETHVLDGTAR